tara:strand:+ start:19425 stop:20312 length:888 start_codon:yes stop_codon:yes gene_type:complete
MKIITYEELNYNNKSFHYINSDIIDKLIFNNANYYYNTNNIAYYLLVIPSLNYKKNSDNSPYRLTEKKLSNKELDISIPSFEFDKIILIYNYKLNKFLIIKSKNYNLLFNNNNIYNFLIDITNNLQNVLNILNNLVMKINYALIDIHYTHFNIITNYIDRMLIYLHYLNNIIQQIINITSLLKKSHEYYDILNKNTSNLSNMIKNLKNDLENIRQVTFQKITYIETGTARILTNVASIFLPISFIIAFFSLPFKNVPLQNNDNGIFLIILIIIVISLILYNTDLMNYINYTTKII